MLYKPKSNQYLVGHYEDGAKIDVWIELEEGLSIEADWSDVYPQGKERMVIHKIKRIDKWKVD